MPISSDTIFVVDGIPYIKRKELMRYCSHNTCKLLGLDLLAMAVDLRIMLPNAVSILMQKHGCIKCKKNFDCKLLEIGNKLAKTIIEFENCKIEEEHCNVNDS